ncbi:MAG: dihydrofolate reductase family protein [Anaerolineae bacterium]|nr:dihydrofolate reductase family protein [Anaerolineae bacterium]
MRKVVAHLFISLDGVIESPEWTMPYWDEALQAELETQLALQDAVLLGRVSYEEWAGYWPTSPDEPFATFINNTPKYVVSTTLDKVEWKHSTLLKGDLADNIRRLKEQPGKNIAVNASPTLVRSLLKLDLLDELRLTLFPVVVGKGTRLFQEGDARKPLKLVESKASPSGVMILAYQPDRKT